MTQHIKLFEAWLNEATTKDVKKVKDILTMPYEKFVNTLKDNAKDPKVEAVLNMGKNDGIKTDEVVEVKEVDLPVSELQPTQSQIGFADSIGYLADKEPAGTPKVIAGDTSGFKENRILTANGKYILDGHHRWSQVFTLNPKAKIPAIDLELPGLDETTLLKVIQSAIAATYKDILKKPADAATDIFDEKKMPKDNLEEKIKEIVGKAKKSKEFMELAKKAYKVGSDEEVIKILVKNAELLKEKKPKKAPAREFMPQPSDTAKKVGRSDSEISNYKGMPKEFIDKLKSGDLNYKAPLMKGPKK